MRKANHGHNALSSATIGDNSTWKAMRFPAQLRGLGVRAQGEQQAEWTFHSLSSRVSDEVSFVRGKVCI